MTMNFRSDNEAPAHQRMIEAIVEANTGFATSYAEDALSERLDTVFSEVFGSDCRVLPLATGTAANSIALAEMTPAWGAILCHEGAHIHNDENGAPEFYSAGAKLVPLPGEAGRLDAKTVAATLDSAGGHGVHSVQPAALSITQATECGTCYRPDEIRGLADVAHARGLNVHMDGARFANAIAWLGCTPAAITWQAGVDALSFGVSKNGALAAEAIVVFGHPEWMEGLARRRKRGGHLVSKMRYVSAQLLAMLEGELWLDLAAHANRQAQRLAAAIVAHPRASLAWPVEANEVFMRAEPAKLEALKNQGFAFHLWPGHEDLARLVCSFATEDDAVSNFIRALDP